MTNNEELEKIYTQDQSDRKQSLDGDIIVANDSLRRTRVYELLDSGLVITGMDYHNAAMIFQHGPDTTSSTMAIQLMKKAVSLDTTISKWLLAAAIDRDLSKRGEPQIYGTQFISYDGENYKLYDIDTTVITAEERAAYDVPTLDQQRARARKMGL